jgi:hypothetical protein
MRQHLPPIDPDLRHARAHRGHGPFDPARFGPNLFAARFGEGPVGPRGGFGPWGRGRARRGDVRAALLALLAERPMHGYEMIQELEGRTQGLWRPSPGSVYPTLQLLEDEGLVTHDEADGKRSFRLTDAGRGAASARGDGPSPWEEVTAGADPQALGLQQGIRNVVVAAAQVVRAGSPGQKEEAIAILADARRRIYGLLARED